MNWSDTILDTIIIIKRKLSVSQSPVQRPIHIDAGVEQMCCKTTRKHDYKKNEASLRKKEIALIMEDAVNR